MPASAVVTVPVERSICMKNERERERERAALSATVVVSQKEKRLTRDLLGRKTRAREPKPEDEEDQGTQTTELS